MSGSLVMGQMGKQISVDHVGHGRDGTGSPGHGSAGHRVSNLGPGRVGSRVKALTRLFDPDSC